MRGLGEVMDSAREMCLGEACSTLQMSPGNSQESKRGE
jgi:hypothetical protein